MSATLQLNKKDRMLYVPLQFRKYENSGLLNTRAIQSALSESELCRILTAHPAALLQELPAPEFKVRIANGNIVPTRKQVHLGFFIRGKIFEGTFMILPTIANVPYSLECGSSRNTLLPWTWPRTSSISRTKPFRHHQSTGESKTNCSH